MSFCDNLLSAKRVTGSHLKTGDEDAKLGGVEVGDEFVYGEAAEVDEHAHPVHLARLGKRGDLY